MAPLGPGQPPVGVQGAPGDPAQMMQFAAMGPAGVAGGMEAGPAPTSQNSAWMVDAVKTQLARKKQADKGKPGPPGF